MSEDKDCAGSCCSAGSEGVRRIAAERKRQVETLGWTAEHDAQHAGGELAQVAALYALAARIQERYERAGADAGSVAVMERLHSLPDETSWPDTWARQWWRPSSDPARNMEKAGALLAAALDRRVAAVQSVPVPVESCPEVARLRDENAKLGAVPAYHHRSCPQAWAGSKRLKAKPCTCGLEEAIELAGIPGPDLAQRLDPPTGQPYLGVMVVTGGAEERDGVPGYVVRYPNGAIDWTPADVFELYCLPLGGSVDVAEGLAGLHELMSKSGELVEGAPERFYVNIGAGLDPYDKLTASNSMLGLLLNWGQGGYANSAASPVVDGLRCGEDCPWPTEDGDECARFREDLEADVVAEVGEAMSLRCPKCLAAYPVVPAAEG